LTEPISLLKKKILAARGAVKKNILVVDDNELILLGLAKVLGNEACAVATADTGTKALEKLSSCRYDLCLLDIHLPDMNGLELMKFIKDMCPHTRVVIMSASYFNSAQLSSNIQEATASGACQFVAKPFSLCEITAVVRKVLGLDEDCHADSRFTGRGFLMKCRRKMQRRALTEQVRFSMTQIVEGEARRMTFQAKAVDLSEEGIALLTDFPLKNSQIISFEAELGNRSGIVVWSEMLDELTYRAGVQFA